MGRITSPYTGLLDLPASWNRGGGCGGTFSGRSRRCAAAVTPVVIRGRDPGLAAVSEATLELNPRLALEVAAALVGGILSLAFGVVINCAPALQRGRIVSCVVVVGRSEVLPLLFVDGVHGGLPRLLESVGCQDV